MSVYEFKITDGFYDMFSALLVEFWATTSLICLFLTYAIEQNGIEKKENKRFKGKAVENVEKHRFLSSW